MFNENLIIKRVPRWIVERVRENMDVCSMGLFDAFDEAVRCYGLEKLGKQLYSAWYTQDYRKYIPSAYLPERLDFSKYPLAYIERSPDYIGKRG